MKNQLVPLSFRMRRRQETQYHRNQATIARSAGTPHSAPTRRYTVSTMPSLKSSPRFVLRPALRAYSYGRLTLMPQLFMPTPVQGSALIISQAVPASSRRVRPEASGAFLKRSITRGSIAPKQSPPMIASGTRRLRRLMGCAVVRQTRAVVPYVTAISAMATREYDLSVAAAAQMKPTVQSFPKPVFMPFIR